MRDPDLVIVLPAAIISSLILFSGKNSDPIEGDTTSGMWSIDGDNNIAFIVGTRAIWCAN
jgi:hypothetical protein